MSIEENEHPFLIHEIPLRPKSRGVDVTYLCKEHEATARRKALKERLDTLADSGQSNESKACPPIKHWPRTPA